MNKLKLALLVSGALVAGVSTSALAAPGETQGTVTFTGKLITETCEIVGDKDKTVRLDPVSIKTLDAEHKEGGFKDFSIAVICPKDPKTFENVGIHFEPVGQGETLTYDARTGNLANSWTPAAGGGDAGKIAATNVQIKIYNTNDGVNTHAKIGQVSKILKPDANGNAVFTYAGGYYATAATGAGEVYAKVQYTLVYP